MPSVFYGIISASVNLLDINSAGSVR